MHNSKPLAKLRQLSEKLQKEHFAPEITFYSGRLLDKFSEVCGKLCPFSKIAMLYSPLDFEKYGEELTSTLKDNGLKVVNVILNEKDCNSDLDNIIASMPENARLIATTSQELVEFSQRLAHNLGVGCVIGLSKIPDTIFAKGAFSPIAVVVDENLSTLDWELYQKLVGKIVCLFDLKVKQFFKIISKNTPLIFDFIDILDAGLSAYLDCPLDYKNKLLESALSLELLSRALNHYEKAYDLKTALCLVKLVAVSLKKEYKAIPNYLERAKAVEKLYGLSYLNVLENIKAQLDGQKLYGENLTDMKKGLSALAQIYLEKTPSIIRTFTALNGEYQDNKLVLTNIKYAGDIHYYNTSASLLRETGCLG